MMSSQATSDHDPFLDRIPPHSLSAERSVLGSMILEREAVGQAIGLLKEECFYTPEHRLIFRALLELYDQNKPSDPVLLRQQLEQSQALEKVGGAEYLVRLMHAVPSAANIEHYAKVVRDKWMLRELILVAGKILQEAYSHNDDPQELLDRAEQKIFEVTQHRVSGGLEQLRQFLEETFSQLDSREGHYITGLPTGFVELDDMTSGLQNGELIIVAGRPSMGKTAFGMNVAEHIAVEEKKPVAFFSLEMSKQQVVQRLLCSRGKVDSHKLRRNMLNDEEIAKLHTACDVLHDAPLYIDDTPGMSVMQLRAKARLLAVRANVAAVFVDYLQLLTSPGAESRQQEVSAISRSLKALARELNVPVIALAQLNRGVEGRESHRPRMSDLRESGSIEQEADLILLLHRQEYYQDMGERTGEDASGVAEVIIAKQRNGPVGTIELQFSKRFTRFNTLARYAVEDDVPVRAYVPPDSGGDVPF